MADLGENAMGETPSTQAWPLTNIVRVQLAVVSVWAPYLLGWLVVLAAATAQFVFEDESLARGGGASHAPVWEVTYWCGVMLGVVVAPIALPKAWPAAARIPPVRRIAASLVGAGSVQAVAVVIKHMGPLTTEASVLVEPLLLLLATTPGAGLVWPMLRTGE